MCQHTLNSILKKLFHWGLEPANGRPFSSALYRYYDHARNVTCDVTSYTFRAKLSSSVANGVICQKMI